MQRLPGPHVYPVSFPRQQVHALPQLQHGHPIGPRRRYCYAGDDGCGAQRVVGGFWTVKGRNRWRAGVLMLSNGGRVPAAERSRLATHAHIHARQRMHTCVYTDPGASGETTWNRERLACVIIK